MTNIKSETVLMLNLCKENKPINLRDIYSLFMDWIQNICIMTLGVVEKRAYNERRSQKLGGCRKS